MRRDEHLLLSDVGTSDLTGHREFEHLFGNTLEGCQHEIDIDGRGDGWIRAPENRDGSLQVGGVAGLASEPNGLPEPIRQWILLLRRRSNCRIMKCGVKSLNFASEAARRGIHGGLSFDLSVLQARAI